MIKVMISVDLATKKVLARKIILKSITLEYNQSPGFVLRETLIADRDFPSMDRVTMDGIAIKYSSFKNGRRVFRLVGMQAAGERPLSIKHSDEAVQIMTGAGLDVSLDCVVPVEQLKFSGDQVTVTVDSMLENQFVHHRGTDAKAGDILAMEPQMITPDVVAVMASVGKTKVKVSKNPSVIVISTGDELTEPTDAAQDFKIRRSNDSVICAMFKKHGIDAKTINVKDNRTTINGILNEAIQNYDVVIVSGGVSKGEFDYVHGALDDLGVIKYFHGVKQKPGKPLWFGAYGQSTVFALPGNPVSVYLCMIRYVLPWLKNTLGLADSKIYAVLDESVNTNQNLTHFILAKTYYDRNSILHAKPIPNNTSGDFISMIDANAFIEFPEGQENHAKGSSFRVWLYKDEII